MINKKQQQILQMSRGAKQNWFQSPHIRSGIWFNYDQKPDIFNLSRHSSQERFTFLTPSRNSKPIEIEKGLKPYSQQVQNNRFQDINLPDMFCNAIVERQVINEKINFEQSSVISEEHDYLTPSKQQDDESYHLALDKQSKQLPKTAAKQRHHSVICHQQRKPRPKQKGLRMLSQKAYEIVSKMNGATYKEVANRLVDELAVEDALEINVVQGKDEQNIKRRVYDALNVLIALGILKKDGRKIYGLTKPTQHQDSSYEAQLQRLTLQLKSKKFKLLEKLNQYRNVKIRAQMIKALINRNRQALHKQQKIEFPFIAVCVRAEDQKRLVVKEEVIEVRCSQRKVEPYGDVDTVQFLSASLMSFSSSQ